MKIDTIDIGDVFVLKSFFGKEIDRVTISNITQEAPMCRTVHVKSNLVDYQFRGYSAFKRVFKNYKGIEDET